MREKLIELLKDTRANAAWHHWGYEESADHLIANGVTFATDNNVGNKCDYCQEDRDGYRKAIGAFFLANPFHGSLWQIKTTRTKPRQIFFCPMCGRKLAAPPKGE